MLYLVNSALFTYTSWRLLGSNTDGGSEVVCGAKDMLSCRGTGFRQVIGDILPLEARQVLRGIALGQPYLYIFIGNIDERNTPGIGSTYVGRSVIRVQQILLIGRGRLQGSIVTRAVLHVSLHLYRNKIYIRTGICRVVESKGWRARINIRARRGCLIEMAKRAESTERRNHSPPFRRTIWTIFRTHIQKLWLPGRSGQCWRWIFDALQGVLHIPCTYRIRNTWIHLGDRFQHSRAGGRGSRS